VDDALITPPTAGAAKSAWRHWARARRQALDAADPQGLADRAVAAHIATWERWRGARVALVYLAFGSEVDPLAGGLLGSRRAPQEGEPLPLLATTRTPSGGGLRVHELDLQALVPHPLGFLQPPADAPLVDLEAIDVALVPGLCFDRRGHRLGYGRAYYDRLLPQLPARVATLGVTREALIVERLPSEPHDAPVGWLVSEAGVRELPA
jgi:5-formyltetrahydrofolate cyclo-ligase